MYETLLITTQQQRWRRWSSCSTKLTVSSRKLMTEESKRQFEFVFDMNIPNSETSLITIYHQ